MIRAEVAGGDPPTKSGGASLGALARTCWTFKNPALDALWRTQTSLTPLVNLFPTKWEGLEENEQDVRLQGSTTLSCLSLMLSNFLRQCPWLRPNGPASFHTLHVSKC